MEKTKGKFSPVVKSISEDVDVAMRDQIDFIINNSNYTTDYIFSVDYTEFYSIILVVERNLKRKAKQN